MAAIMFVYIMILYLFLLPIVAEGLRSLFFLLSNFILYLYTIFQPSILTLTIL